MTINQLADHGADITGKRVIVRTNYDVPIENGVVADSTRIEDSIPTIAFLLAHSCRVILLSHYDRPDGLPSPEKSLRPVLSLLQSHFSQPVEFSEYKPDIQAVAINPNAQITLVENLRFWAEEEANDQQFAKALSLFGDIYVNEAFANCHRDHASMTGITRYLPSYAGISLSKELSVLHQVTTNPNRPLVVVIGGAKLETKEPLVNRFIPIAQTILVGGKIAADMREHQSLSHNVVVASLTPDGSDITLESANTFSQVIMSAGTVIWNGTLGKFEDSGSKQGTTIVATAVNQTSAFTLIGGGDTEAALTELNLESGIDYISTGGGAMLTYLSEGDLIAVKPLYQL